MFAVQAAQLPDIQEQEEFAGQVGAEEVLPLLPNAYSPPGDEVGLCWETGVVAGQ
jgi:hypothetical protein